MTDKLQNMKFKFIIDQSSMEDQKNTTTAEAEFSKVTFLTRPAPLETKQCIFARYFLTFDYNTNGDLVTMVFHKGDLFVNMKFVFQTFVGEHEKT